MACKCLCQPTVKAVQLSTAYDSSTRSSWGKAPPAHTVTQANTCSSVVREKRHGAINAVPQTVIIPPDFELQAIFQIIMVLKNPQKKVLPAWETWPDLLYPVKSLAEGTDRDLNSVSHKWPFSFMCFFAFLLFSFLFFPEFIHSLGPDCCCCNTLLWRMSRLLHIKQRSVYVSGICVHGKWSHVRLPTKVSETWAWVFRYNFQWINTHDCICCACSFRGSILSNIDAQESVFFKAPQNCQKKTAE